MAFEQATIKIQKEEEFAKLQAAVEQAFLPEKTERFLKQLDRKGIRVREFEAVLSARALESCRSAVRLERVAVVPGAAGFRSGADAGVLSFEAGRRRRCAAA